MNCQGPCLTHCYKKNSILLIIVGILIGIILSELYRNKTNNKEKII